MIQKNNLLKFQIENLEIDYLSFNINGLKDPNSIRPFESLLKELAKVLSATLKTNLMSCFSNLS